MFLIIVAIVIALASIGRIFSGYDIGAGFAGILVAVGIDVYEFYPDMFAGMAF